ncbi:unnamed protein product, partial [Strongylus vulgaris]
MEEMEKEDKTAGMVDYDPGSKWTKTFGRSEYKGFEEWIERTYKCDDGRQMDFAIAGMRKLLCTVYDFRMVLKGVKGTMGTEGGSNGVGGEGGNRGEFLARRISSGDRISGCGRPGDPGSNGNDVALIDQSGGGNPWEKRVDRYYYGHKSQQSISYTYHYDSQAYTRLSGYRKYIQKKADCFVGFSTSSVDRIQCTKNAEKRNASDRQRRSQAVSKQNISVDAVLEEFMEKCVKEEIDVHYNEKEQFNVHVVEETEEDQKMKEQITVVKDHVICELHTIEKEEGKVVRTEEVEKRIQRAVNDK